MPILAAFHAYGLVAQLKLCLPSFHLISSGKSGNALASDHFTGILDAIILNLLGISKDFLVNRGIRLVVLWPT
jgi:hypothetical protein